MVDREARVTMESTDGIVLPVSALKSESTRVFDALAEGRTVYVSKHGDIIAAFRPFDEVPLAVAATYVAPNVATAELTARAMQRAAPTRAVGDAARGLPSLVTRDHEVYGVLTAASAPPAVDVVPDLDAAEARSEAMRTFLTDHPGASIDEIAAYRASLDTDLATGPVTEPDTGSMPARVSAGPRAPRSARRGAPGRQRRSSVARRVVIALRAAGDLAETDPASARAVYVGALGSERDRGVLWRLGDLARSEGDVVEAAEWYRLALQGDTQPEAEPAAVAGIAADPNGEPARIDRAEGVR